MSSNIFKAIGIASSRHRDEKRKTTGIPYIVHPIDVMNRLVRAGVLSENVWCAAVLHDVLESAVDDGKDPEGYRHIIKCETNDEILAIVDELTYDKTKGTKEEYVDSFKDKSVQALLVKVSDRLSNTKDFLTSDEKYAKKYWEKASSLIDAFYDREAEICGVFGERVFDNLEHEIGNVVYITGLVGTYHLKHNQ